MLATADTLPHIAKQEILRHARWHQEYVELDTRRRMAIAGVEGRPLQVGDRWQRGEHQREQYICTNNSNPAMQLGAVAEMKQQQPGKPNLVC